MHVRAVIPHYFHEAEEGETIQLGEGFGSRQRGARSRRVLALQRCLLGLLNQATRGQESFLNIKTTKCELVDVHDNNHQFKEVTIEIVVVIQSQQTCLDNVLLDFGDHLRVLPCGIEDPRLLGLKARDYLIRHPEPADLNLYLEDDLVIQDPYFFDKILWVARQSQHTAVLFPHRYEIIPGSMNKSSSRLFIDGAIDIEEIALWHEPKANIASGKFLGDILVSFDVPVNPHSGFFGLTADQIWLVRDSHLPESGFVGPLEVAATMTVGNFFQIWKCSPVCASFFAIEHAFSSFLGYL